MASKIELDSAKKRTQEKSVVYDYASKLFVVILLILGSLYGYQRYQHYQEQQAQEVLWPSVYLVEAKKYKQALKGSDTSEGLLWLIENYPRTKAAQQGYIYLGGIYIRLGKYEKALYYLNKFTIPEKLFQARVEELKADAHRALGNDIEALAGYKRAAACDTNTYFTPIQLYKAAQLYEKQEKLEDALALYQRICKDFYKSHLFIKANQHAERLRILLKRPPVPLD